MVVLCVLLAMTGCNLLDRDTDESFNPIAPPTTGNANVKFQIVLPGENAGTIKPALRFSTGASVQFRLALVFPGTEGTAQTAVLQRRVSVNPATGDAEVTFPGVPQTSVIGQVQIEGGNLGGKNSFHGALDLSAGDNVVELAPVGSGHPADVAAGVMLDIIKVPEIVKAAPANLVTAITTTAQESINSDLSGAELYNDVLNRFVTSPLLPTLSLLKISVTNDYGLLFESGPQTSLTKTPAELWSEIPGADGLLARRIIRQGFGDQEPLVAFTDFQREKFALAYVSAEGRISQYFLSDKNTLSHLSAVQIVSEDDSVVFGAVANGLPVIIRWDGKNSATCGWPVSDSSVHWSSVFPHITADARISYPTVDMLMFDPGVQNTFRSIVRNPKSLMLQEYKISLAGAITPMFSPVEEALFALTALPGNREITLHWDSIPNAEFYTLYWSLTSEIPRSGDGVNSISRVTRPFVHSGLQENQTYHYVITWTINGEESAPSKAATATPWYTPAVQYYRITYYGNGQTGGLAPIDSVSYFSGDSAEILAPGDSFGKAGYKFVCWNTAEDGSGTDYTPGQQVEIETAGLILYAKWWAPTVIYSGNGHTAGQPPVSAVYATDSEVVVAGNTGNLQKTGYVFAGWNTAADGSGSYFQAGENFAMGADDLILYAVWSAPTRVTYYGNNHTAGNVPVDSTVYEFGDSVTLLTGDSISRDGYVFIGWNTAADGSGTDYAAGATVSMPADGLSFYAKWRSTFKYQVSFLGNGSDGGSVPATLLHMEGDVVTVPGNTGNLTNAGKTFFGWNTSADGSGREYVAGNTFVMDANNVSFYAQWQEFAGGDGSSTSPYLVANAPQLNRVRNHLDAYFMQIADIDLSGTIFSTGNGWEPIGSSTITAPSSRFHGTYDGNGKKIANLFIDRDAEDAVGLFGFAQNAVIKNLSVENADVTGKNNVGILIGNAVESSISNCHSSGRIQGDMYRIGGIAGIGMDVVIDGSSSSASVSGGQFLGGLIGEIICYTLDSTISNCQASGAVSGITYVGGLFGIMAGDGDKALKAVVRSSSASGDVSGEYAGGLVGQNGIAAEIKFSSAEGKLSCKSFGMYVGGLVGFNKGNIDNSYAIGTVSGQFSAGGLVGKNEGLIDKAYAAGAVTGISAGGLCSSSTGTITASYWDSETTGQSTSSGGSSLTTAQMQQQSSFSGWDFSTVWTIKAGSYPTLR